MKKLYFLDEQEKNRILNLHTEATKNQYLINKKLLLESGAPAVRTIWKVINKMFGVGKGDDIVTKAIAKDSKFNYKIIEALDDVSEALKNQNIDIDDYVFTATDGSKFLQDTGKNTISYNKIVDKVEKVFPNGIKDDVTDEKIKEVLSILPEELMSKFTSNKIPLKLKNLWKAELDKLVKEKKPGALKRYQSAWKHKPYTTALGTTIAGLGLFTAVRGLWLTATKNWYQSGSGSRKAISEKIDKLIINSCSAITSNEFVDLCYDGQTLDTTSLARSIFQAGINVNMVDFVDTGTDEAAIQTNIEKTQNMTNFCKLVNKFGTLFKIGRGSEYYTNRPYKYTLVNFLDYEFSGRFYDDVGSYQDFVEKPINNLITRTTMDIDKAIEKSKEEAKEKDKEKTRTDASLKVENCATDQTWKCLVGKRPAFAKYPCVKSEYDKSTLKIGNEPFSSTKRIYIEKQGADEYNYVRIGNIFYYPGQIQIYGETTKQENAFNFTCSGTNVSIDKSTEVSYNKYD